MKRLALAVLLLASPAWAQFDNYLGQDRTGRIQGIPTAYNPDPAWPAYVAGDLYGGPVYEYNDKIITVASENGRRSQRIVCYSKATGALVWQKKVNWVPQNTLNAFSGDYPRHWVFGIVRGPARDYLLCTGEWVWSDEHGALPDSTPFTSSVSKGSLWWLECYLNALDPNTGTLLWQSSNMVAPMDRHFDLNWTVTAYGRKVLLCGDWDATKTQTRLSFLDIETGERMARIATNQYPSMRMLIPHQEIIENGSGVIYPALFGEETGVISRVVEGAQDSPYGAILRLGDTPLPWEGQSGATDILGYDNEIETVYAISFPAVSSQSVTAHHLNSQTAQYEQQWAVGGDGIGVSSWRIPTPVKVFSRSGPGMQHGILVQTDTNKFKIYADGAAYWAPTDISRLPAFTYRFQYRLSDQTGKVLCIGGNNLFSYLQVVQTSATADPYPVTLSGANSYYGKAVSLGGSAIFGPPLFAEDATYVNAGGKVLKFSNAASHKPGLGAKSRPLVSAN
jgi:hypothetical protein